MNIWKQIANLKTSASDDEFKDKMRRASESTIISIKKLDTICKNEAHASNGNG